MQIRHLTQPDGPALGYVSVPIIEKDGCFYKDPERAGEVLPYCDWHLTPMARAEDLAKRLSIEEIAGLMLYSPHQAVPSRRGMPFQGTYGGKCFEDSGCEPDAMNDQQQRFIETDHIRHILLTAVDSAAVSARWSNRLQAAAEAQPHAIPVNLSTDPRNGARDSDAEFKSSGTDVSKWPEGLGFASCFDPEVARQFAEDASREYRALGIATALGPQIDLCTEPRWMRLADTFGPETEMAKAITKAYCDGMQTTKAVNGWGMESVNTMVKHWPGGGTGEGGRDAHYAFGEYAVYPSGNFEEHLKPFTEAAFRLDGPTKRAASVMPYYTVSWGIDTKNGRNTGNSYSEYIIKDLLRGKYAFDGVVCTDWGITGDPAPSIEGFGSRCYGMQDKTEAERHYIAIMNGVDQFGGNSDPAPILKAYRIGCREIGEEAMRARMERSAARLLRNIFQCGLFEDPYLDPERSAAIVGCEEFTRHGFEAQQKSLVLLKNQGALPLAKGLKVYVPNRHIGPSKSFFRTDVPARDADPLAGIRYEKYFTRVDTPEEADLALVFIESPVCNPYTEEDGYLPISLQYRPYTALTAREKSIAGGDFREKDPNRSYRGKTNTPCNAADLDNVLACREAMGKKPVIVCATLNNPCVPAEFEPAADAILADFGVSKAAVFTVLFGEYAPSGRLPVQLPRDMETVEAHSEDKAFDMIPYTDSVGNVYDYGFGLKY